MLYLRTHNPKVAGSNPAPQPFSKTQPKSQPNGIPGAISRPVWFFGAIVMTFETGFAAPPCCSPCAGSPSADRHTVQWSDGSELDWKILSWALTRSEEHTSELQSLRHLVCR